MNKDNGINKSFEPLIFNIQFICNFLLTCFVISPNRNVILKNLLLNGFYNGIFSIKYALYRSRLKFEFIMLKYISCV